MAKLTWGATEERIVENGVRKVVVYPMASDGSYEGGIAWNGVSAIALSPTGAEVTSLYADDRRYLNLYSVEELGMTIESFTMPDEFKECCGIIEFVNGADIWQQDRKAFGLCYRTNIASDKSFETGYKIQIVYSALALPSSVNYQSINDSPEPVQYSFDLTALQVHSTDLKPYIIVILNSLTANKVRLHEIEDIIYGSDGVNPRLPFPEEIINILTIKPGRYDVARSDYDACYYS